MSSPQKVNAYSMRDIMNIPIPDMCSGYLSNNHILFDDGVVKFISYKETYVDRYTYEVLKMVNLSYDSKYHIGNFYINGFYSKDSLKKCLESMLPSICSVTPRDKLGDVYLKMHEIMDDIYNNLVYLFGDYIGTLSLESFLEIQNDPELLDAIRAADLDNNDDTIANIHKTLDRVIRYPKYSHNQLARGYKAEILSQSQIRQMIGARGRATEIDGTIFDPPIRSNFLIGLDLYEYMAENRVGAKALHLNGRAIANSEYTGREFQIALAGVNRVIDGDCGTKSYTSWLVRPIGPSNPKSDVDLLLGIRFLNSDGVEEIITAKHKYLENTVIKIRTALSCQHPNPHVICSACFGELASSLHPHTHIGLLAATIPNNLLSQGILSTKHDSGNVKSVSISLDSIGSNFFVVKNNNMLCLKAGMVKHSQKVKYTLLINQPYLFGLKDLSPAVDVSTLNPRRISSISLFTLVVTTNGVPVSHPILLNNGNVQGSLTCEFIAYMMTGKCVLDDRDRYVIDLSGWVTAEPIIVAPNVEFSYMKISAAFKSMFKNMKTVNKVRNIKNTKESMLQEAFDLLNSKLAINIAWIAVIVYGFTAKDSDNGDYTLGRGVENANMSNFFNLIPNNSLGGALAWEVTHNILTSPMSLLPGPRNTHLLDVLLAPDDTLAEFKARGLSGYNPYAQDI